MTTDVGDGSGEAPDAGDLIGEGAGRPIGDDVGHLTGGGTDGETAEAGDASRSAPAEPRPDAGELEMLTGTLDSLRWTIDWKTGQLDGDQLETVLPPSTMTLGGLLAHLTFVEDFWFSLHLLGEPTASVATPAAWAQDPDRDWHSAQGKEPGRLRREWLEAVARSRANTARVLERARVRGEADPLGTASVYSHRGSDPPPSLRWILVHMVEEYARHAGHADLIRESIDGLVGDRPDQAAGD